MPLKITGACALQTGIHLWFHTGYNLMLKQQSPSPCTVPASWFWSRRNWMAWETPSSQKKNCHGKCFNLVQSDLPHFQTCSTSHMLIFSKEDPNSRPFGEADDSTSLSTEACLAARAMGLGRSPKEIPVSVPKTKPFWELQFRTFGRICG